MYICNKKALLREKPCLFLFLRREGFLRNPQSLPRASSATQNEEVAGATLFFDLCTFPFNKLMSMCLYTKNEPYRTRSSFCVAEREGLWPNLCNILILILYVSN